MKRTGINIDTGINIRYLNQELNQLTKSGRIKDEEYLVIASDEYGGGQPAVYHFKSRVTAQTCFRANVEYADLEADWSQVLMLGSAVAFDLEDDFLHSKEKARRWPAKRTLLAFRMAFSAGNGRAALNDTKEEKKTIKRTSHYYTDDGAIKDEYQYWDNYVGEEQ